MHSAIDWNCLIFASNGRDLFRNPKIESFSLMSECTITNYKHITLPLFEPEARDCGGKDTMFTVFSIGEVLSNDEKAQWCRKLSQNTPFSAACRGLIQVARKCSMYHWYYKKRKVEGQVQYCLGYNSKPM